jgi:hypothetical protein
MLVTDTEVIETPPAGKEKSDELLGPGPTFGEIVSQFENCDELLADPDFNPAKLAADLRDKVDRMEYFINQFARPRRETYKKVGQGYIKTGVAMENNIKGLQAYIVENMRAEKLKKGDSYPGNLKRLQLMQNPDRFEIDSEPGPAFHLKYPQFCQVEVIKSYKWDYEAVEQAFKDKKLPEEIVAKVKDGSYYPQFFNNVKPKPKSKKVAKKTTKKVREKVNAATN